MPEAAVCGVHDATGTFVVVIGAGQVVVVQLLPDVAADAVQLATGTLVVLFVEQVRVTQLLPDAAVCGVQVATGTLVVLLVEQVVTR